MGQKCPFIRHIALNPKTEIRTADFTDFTDDKRVSFTARCSDSSGLFASKFLFIRVIRVIRGFNFGSRVKHILPIFFGIISFTNPNCL